MRRALDAAVTAGVLATLALAPVAHGAVEAWSVALLELAIVALALAWWTGRSLSGDARPDVPSPYVPLLLIAAFGVIQGVAPLATRGAADLSLDPEATRSAALLLLLLLGFGVLAATQFATRARARTLAVFVTVLGFGLAVFALVQAATWNGMIYWVRPVPEGAMPFGPFVNRNHFAGYLEMIAPIPAALVLTRAARPYSTLAVFASAMMGVAVLASASRGGFVALASGLAFVAVVAPLARRGRARAAWTGAALLGALGVAILLGTLALAPRSVFGRASGDDGEVAERVWQSFYESRGWIWANTVRVIADRPLAGSGLGAFATAFRAHGTASDVAAPNGATLVVGQAHNDYLQVLADFGVAGGALAVWFLVALGRAVARGVRAEDRLFAGLALGGGGGLCALAVHSLFDFNLHIPSHAALALVLTAVIWRAGTTASAASGETRETSMYPPTFDAVRAARRVAALALAALVLPAAAARAQDGAKPGLPREQYQQAPTPAADAIVSNTVVTAGEDYRFGVGDELSVAVEDAPELSRDLRVSRAGEVELPYVGRIAAKDLTADELAAAVAAKLRGGYLTDPKVSVRVRQVNSRTYFIQGAVRRPGFYRIEGRPSLLKLIVVAGGLADNYGSTAFILREKTAPADAAPASSASATSPDYEVLRANVSGILRGNLENNVFVEPGDIVHVPPADVFYVAGEVNSPGAFPLKDGTTIRQALLLAQGTTFKAARDRAVVFRDDPATGARTEIPVDVDAVMKGTAPDVAIGANDVVVVPNSRMRSVGGALLNALGGNLTRLPVRGY